ncbi:MAG TPA: alpha/beta fold hydrolase [Ferruginibacter sp.]|nr:alpha/beta fold hydrolase [Ferruginibacter sp.]
MKSCIITSCIIFAQAAIAQPGNFVGAWEGKLDVGITLRIGFHFIKEGNAYITKMDSPDQGVFGIPTDQTIISGDSVYISLKKFNASFLGKMKNDSIIDGIFEQGKKFMLLLKKVEKILSPIKPQTPIPPYPYISEDIFYFNKNKTIEFGATLTYPFTDTTVDHFRTPVYPVIMLISGSGPQNRDEEILGHKPFAVIADYLTKKGFAVLRVDDRGTGKTTGSFETSTSADFVEDVHAGVEYLKTRQNIDTGRFGLLGHSEGGMIAPIVASQRKDINFIILLAAPGIPIIDLMTEQNIALLNSGGISIKTQQSYGHLFKSLVSTIISATDSSVAKNNAGHIFNNWINRMDSSGLKELDIATKEKQEVYLAGFVKGLNIPWYKYFMSFDPGPYLQNLKSKVLALNGSRDIQVLSKSNLAGIRSALQKSKSSKYDVIELPGLNHLFQQCKKCTISEYGELEETFSQNALNKIDEWLKKNL